MCDFHVGDWNSSNTLKLNLTNIKFYKSVIIVKTQWKSTVIKFQWKHNPTQFSFNPNTNN